MIKAIETHYKGYRFRSRLEARWAVFFDALDIKWEYEPEGYDLNEFGLYLPDFFLPEFNCWIEIKGTYPSDLELDKCRYLSENLYGATHNSDIILVCDADLTMDMIKKCGLSNEDAMKIMREKINKSGKVYLFYGLAEWGFFTTGDLSVQVLAKNVLESFILLSDQKRQINVKIEGDWHPRKIFPAALDKARSARFEHGETPQ